MLAAVVRFSIRHPWLIVAAAVLLLSWGGQTLLHAHFDVFPEFVPPQAEIQVEAPGLPPEDVERLVTQPLENAINGGANIAGIRSESIQGLAAITVVFTAGTDIFRARQLLAERVSEAASSLPAGARAPVLGPLTSSTMDLLKIGFLSDTVSGTDLRTFVDVTVRPRLLAVPGVARAIVYGGGRREIQIRPDLTKLAALGLAMTDLTAAARGATAIGGSGYIETANDRIVINTPEPLHTPDQIGEVSVTQREGNNVRLKDVALVGYAAEPAFGDARVQGKPDVLVSLGSQYGANTLEVTRAVEAALDELGPILAARGVRMMTGLQRPANFIETALLHVRNSLLLGALLVVAVLIVFLRNWRIALISFATIPLSLLAAVIVMELAGWTLNTMTLGGLAVALGVVVDDAIIDIENIVRRLREARRLHQGGSVGLLIVDASLEVRRPIVLATLIVSLVFVPVLLLPGLQGSFFGPLAGAFLIAIFASLVLALTLTPAMALLLLRQPGPVHEEPRWLRRLKVLQSRTFDACRHHALALLGATLVAGAAAAAALLGFGTTLMPEFREGHFVVQVTAPAGISLREMTRVGERISLELTRLERIATVSLQVGRAESGEDTWSPNRAELHVELQADTPGAQQERIQDEIRAVLAGYPGFQSEVVTFLGDRISESVSGETAAMTVGVYGTDLLAIDETARAVATRLRALPGAADVQFEDGAGVPALSVTLRPERLALFGLRPADVYEAIRTGYAGSVVAEVFEGNQALAVRVILDESLRSDPAQLAVLPLRTVVGRLIPLSAVAAVETASGRERVSHERAQRRQVVTLNPDVRDLASFVQESRTALAEDVPLPAGVTLQISGNAEAEARATRQLLTQAVTALAVIIVLLLFTFGTWQAAALVLVNVPFALLGGAVAIASTGATMSIGTLVGLVTLFGISARNSIMLIAHYEHLVTVEGHGWTRMTARRGVRERVTPILMTALVTALAVLPLALGNGEAGREIEGPMAIVILGGLVSSTLLNLIVLPPLAARFLTFTAARTEVGSSLPSAA